MPEPISSNASSSSGTSYDPTVDEETNVCRPDAPNSSQAPPPAPVSSRAEPPPSPAVNKLLSSVPAPPAMLPAPSKSPVPAPVVAHNNAERTAERARIAPYMAAGRVGDTYSLYAGAAMLKGRDPKTGLDVEVLSVSGQVGTQEEWQVGLVRVGKSTAEGSASVEAMTVRINRGIYNDDGSVGLNLSAQVTAIGGEATVGGTESVTAGASAGMGGGGSLGIRDSDGDGDHELCAKVSYGVFTWGGCVETPF